MTREEIKEELLTDDDQQFKTMVAAQIAVLYEYLVKKEVFTEKDIKEMNKSTEELAEKINELSVELIMKKIEEGE
ncbi:MAG: hypothetical protein IJO32_00445 [Bacilli bacterium]|nr:hypothetical protein [Bacilli bacterium]